MKKTRRPFRDPARLVILSLFFITGCGAKEFVSPFSISQSEAVDFLWVLDGSDSMRVHRERLSQNVRDFFLNGSSQSYDIQMAVTTMDTFAQGGQLIEGTNGPVVATRRTRYVADEFVGMIDSIRPQFTSFWEQGLEASLIAVQEHGTKFSRRGVPLVVLHLTDEDDYSCEEYCTGIEPENNSDWKAYSLDRYENFFKLYAASNEAPVLFYPVVGKTGSQCPIGSLGVRYLELQKRVSGQSLSGDVCDDDPTLIPKAVLEAIELAKHWGG